VTGHIDRDHVHLLLSSPPSMVVPQVGWSHHPVRLRLPPLRRRGIFGTPFPTVFKIPLLRRGGAEGDGVVQTSEDLFLQKLTVL
jgi:hypothetical protein